MVYYENVWTWEGKTSKSSSTTKRSLTYPVDPFPNVDVIDTTKTAILSESVKALQEEMSTLGISVEVTKIEPEAWIQTSKSCRQFRDYTECTWQHWLGMRAKVYFRSNKPLTASPIDPATLAALGAIVVKIIAVIAAAAVIYGIAVFFIESFVVTKHTVTTKKYDEEGNLIEEKTETIIEPTIGGQIGMIIMVVAVLMIVLMFLGRGSKK